MLEDLGVRAVCGLPEPYAVVVAAGGQQALKSNRKTLVSEKTDEESITFVWSQQSTHAGLDGLHSASGRELMEKGANEPPTDGIMLTAVLCSAASHN